jgi:hypothetical protein
MFSFRLVSGLLKRSPWGDQNPRLPMVEHSGVMRVFDSNTVAGAVPELFFVEKLTGFPFHRPDDHPGRT